MRGKLIVFEGGEGSGKTTQIQQLHGWLQQHKTMNALQVKKTISGVKVTREPGGTELGTKIRHLLLNQTAAPESGEQQAAIVSKAELLLYAADRAQHVEETLVPWLDAGYWVLCDRYTDSTVAYQGYGRQLDLSLINTLNQIATDGLKSDLTLWLNVSPDVGLSRMRQRGEADRIEQASLAFHQRVRAGFTALAAQELESAASDRTLKDRTNSGPTIEIDGSQSLHAVAQQIQSVVNERLNMWY